MLEEHHWCVHAPQNTLTTLETNTHTKSNRHQYPPDQCQQRSVFECHDGSMNALNVRELKAILRVSDQTIYRMIADHTIPFFLTSRMLSV